MRNVWRLKNASFVLYYMKNYYFIYELDGCRLQQTTDKQTELYVWVVHRDWVKVWSENFGATFMNIASSLDAV